MENKFKVILFTATGGYWPHYTKIIVHIWSGAGKVNFYRCYYNSNSQHAEAIMLSDSAFKSEISASHSIYITLTINYSPCGDCATELISFYDENESRIQSFTIQCSSLYRQNVEENRSGLKSLIKAGIHLKAMNEDSWEELASLINVKSAEYDWCNEKVKNRDEKTGSALQVLQEEIDKEEEGELAAGLESLSLFKAKELSDEETTDEETEDDESTDDESTNEEFTDDESTDEEFTDDESTDEEFTDEETTDEETTDEEI